MADTFQNYYQREDLWSAEVVTPHGAVASEIIGMLPADAKSILDVGCGNGAISNFITDRFVVGSDIALAAVKYMRHPACLADIGEMPFADNSFDLVMATDVLEHIPDNQYAEACAEIARIARRWILIAVPYRELLDAATVDCAVCGKLYHVHWHQRSYDETFLGGHWPDLAPVSRWALAGERWIWTSQAVLDLKHAALGRNYDFPQAVCPECGTLRGDRALATSNEREREFESLHYALVEAGAAPHPPCSEILALFDKQASGPATFVGHVERSTLPSQVRPGDLPRRKNPEAYPTEPYVTDVREDSFVVVWPSLPRKILCPGVSGAIYDAVDDAYRAVDFTGEEDLPDVRPVRSGYLLRVDTKVDTCDTMMLTGVRPARILRAGPGSTDVVARLRTEFADASSALEQRRDEAEQAAANAMRLVAVAEAQIASLHERAREVEARRSAAERSAENAMTVISAYEERLNLLLDTSNRTEEARVASENLAATLRKNLDQAEAALLNSENLAATLRKNLDRAEAALLNSKNLASALRNDLDRAETARQSSENLASVLREDLAQAVAERVNSEERILAIQSELERVNASRVASENLASVLQGDLGRAKTTQSAFAERLKAEGSVERPTVRDLARRYKRAVVETIDWVTIRRPKHGPKRPHSQVLVISHMYPRSYNKISGIFVHEQVKALRDQGVDVRVVSGEPFWVRGWSIAVLIKGLRAYRRAPFDTVDHEGVPVTYFPWFVGSWVPHWAQAWTYSHGLSRIWKEWAKDNSIGIVHAHTANLDGTAARKVAARTGGRFVITEHTGPFDVLTNHPIKRLKTRAAVRAADRVFAVSSALRAAMIEKLGFAAQRVEVLSNGVDLSVFAPAEDLQRSYATNALWIGHHVSVKRIDRLLAAFARAKEHNPALRLSLLGGGELLDQARDQVDSLGLGDNVKFLPAADRAGVAAEIRAHDYVVISSETETFGSVALEAMACGKPVLSTACGGPQDVIVADYLGLIVENSEDGLAGGLVEMARRSEMFEPTRIRSHVERTGSWAQIAQSLTEAYAAALDQD